MIEKGHCCHRYLQRCFLGVVAVEKSLVILQ